MAHPSPPAHPNVKVFISHCGMLGTQEALYAGTPMLGLPIFGDQPKNAQVIYLSFYFKLKCKSLFFRNTHKSCDMYSCQVWHYDSKLKFFMKAMNFFQIYKFLHSINWVSNLFNSLGHHIRIIWITFINIWIIFINNFT